MDFVKQNVMQVFVPGLLQTGLTLNGVALWPPSSDLYLSLQQNDILRKFLKIEPREDIGLWSTNLLSPKVQVGGFISPYKQFEETFLHEEHAIFCYDWRQSQMKSAEELIEFLSELEVPETHTIEVIGYSLGGCIAFIALAEAQKRNLSFMKQISKLITIGSPLKGSISATAAILGINVQADNENIMKIIHQDNFDSIYELLTSTPHLYFFNEDGTPLSKEFFFALLINSPNINPDKIRKALAFKKKYADLILRGVNIECFRGLEYGAQNICKCIVKKDKTIIPFYETNNSDGKISLYESTLFDSHTYTIRTVSESHGKLLESDELKTFLSDGINLSELRVKVVDTTINTITFSLYTQTLTEVIPLRRLTASKIVLRNKTVNKDVTSGIREKRNLQEVHLTIPSSYESGCLIFTGVSFTFMKDGVKNKIKRDRIVVSFDIFNSTIFF